MKQHSCRCGHYAELHSGYAGKCIIHKCKCKGFKARPQKGKSNKSNKRHPYTIATGVEIHATMVQSRGVGAPIIADRGTVVLGAFDLRTKKGQLGMLRAFQEHLSYLSGARWQRHILPAPKRKKR